MTRIMGLNKYYLSECKYLFEFLDTQKVPGQHFIFSGESHCQPHRVNQSRKIRCPPFVRGRNAPSPHPPIPSPCPPPVGHYKGHDTNCGFSTINRNTSGPGQSFVANAIHKRISLLLFFGGVVSIQHPASSENSSADVH